MIDWSAIEAEYVTTNISQRQLAEKHGISRGRLGEYAKKEQWREKRKKNREKTAKKTANRIGNDQARRTAKYIKTSDTLLDKVQKLLNEDETVSKDVTALREISAILKNLKDIQMIRAEADTREQEARIEKLKADARLRSADEDDGESGVVLMPAVKETDGDG